MNDDIFKREEQARRKYAKYRSLQYAKFQDRKILLRQCNYSPAFLRAAVMIDAEKNFLRKNGIISSQKFLDEFKKQRSMSLEPKSGLESEEIEDEVKEVEIEKNENSFNNFVSTSVSYTSNIDLTEKQQYNIGGSLPNQVNQHIPLHKTNAIFPEMTMARFTLSGQKFDEKDGRPSFSEKSPLYTSTPLRSQGAPQLALQTKPISAISASTSTDSGKFSLVGDKSDAETTVKDDVKTPVANIPKTGENLFSGFKFPQSKLQQENVIANEKKTGIQESKLFTGINMNKPLFGTKTNDVDKTTKFDTQNTTASIEAKPKPLFFGVETTQNNQKSLFGGGIQSNNQIFGVSKPIQAQQQLNEQAKEDKKEEKKESKQAGTGITFGVDFFSSLKPSDTDTTLTNQQAKDINVEEKPKSSLFGSITSDTKNNQIGDVIQNKRHILTSTQNSQQKNDNTNRTTTTLSQNLSTGDKPSLQLPNLSPTGSTISQPTQKMPAIRWIEIMSKVYNKYKEDVTPFYNNPKLSRFRHQIRAGINNLIDRTLQLYENKDDEKTSLVTFTLTLKKISEGEVMLDPLDPDNSYRVNINDVGQRIYLMETLTIRIFDMIQSDKLLVNTALLLHQMICRIITNFDHYFRSYIVTHSYLLQLTCTGFAKVLKKRIKKESDPVIFVSHCLNEKPIIHLFCLIEKEKPVQKFNRLQDLSGQRLIWEFCLAYESLSQVPIATLTTMFVILKETQNVFTNPSHPYVKQFSTLMINKLKNFVEENVTKQLDIIIKELELPALKNVLENCHLNVQQNVKKAINFSQ